MHVANYIGLAHSAEQHLEEALLSVAEHHRDEPDIEQTSKMLAGWSHGHLEQLAPIIARYREHREEEPAKLHHALFHGPRKGGVGLLRDLQDLWLLANEVCICWTVISQAAKALHDQELLETCERCCAQTTRQQAWLLTRIKQAAPQALVAA